MFASSADDVTGDDTVVVCLDGEDLDGACPEICINPPDSGVSALSDVIETQYDAW
jgi:hypothetical protein